MSFFLYQLRFNTPVHFGGSDSALSLYSSEDHFRADTLFSALCHTALQMYGQAGVDRLVTLARSGDLLLSDSMPWAGENFYLPKPYYTGQMKRELPVDKRKVMKKITWLPADRFAAYCGAICDGELFECRPVVFGKKYEVIKAMIQEQDDTRPYPVGVFHFREDCGLYFLAMCRAEADREWFSGLLRGLGISGIGGKVSAGYGKFSVVREIALSAAEEGQTGALYRALTQEQDRSMLLTTSLPRDEELADALTGAGYQLIRRSGFVASDTYAQTPRKKRTQYYLDAGSVVEHRFSGDVYEIGIDGTHPVYRYSKPLFLGVKL